MTDQNSQPDSPPDFFVEIKQYQHADGRSIVEYIPHGDVPEGFARFVGQGMVELPVPAMLADGKRYQTATRGYEFPIPAQTIAEAFEIGEELHRREHQKCARALQDEMQAGLEQVREQQRRRQTGLVGPNGLRLTE